MDLKEEEGPHTPVFLPWAGCGLVTAEIGCLSQRFVDPDSFGLPQQLKAARRRVQALQKLHPASGAVICQIWLFWSTLALSSG